jgi:hypothetical protein
LEVFVRKILFFAVFALLLATLFLAACSGPKVNQAPVTENGEPILADIDDGAFQITLPYFNAAIQRVPISNRAQYGTLEGKREFLEKIVVEAVFYLEGTRRKFFKKAEFRKTLRAHAYATTNDLGRNELAKKIEIGDDQIRAEYEKFIKAKEGFPFEQVKEEIRHRLLARQTEAAYQAKKKELAKAWHVKVDYEMLKRLNPFKLKEADKADLPKLDEALATGDDYTYTIANLLMRLDETPAEQRQKLRDHPDPKKIVDFILSEDLINTWVKREGLDTQGDVELRRKVIEVGTLSKVTRDEILGEDISASDRQARAYYKEHMKDLAWGGEGPPYDAVSEIVQRLATEKMVDDATAGLAQSLMAHRYETTYFEPNITKHLQ